MAEETAKGKSTVSFTEWKIEKYNGRLFCVKYETVTTDGVQGSPEKKREVAVPGPDLVGQDIQLISDFCRRFGFNVSSLADECRDSDYQSNARTMQRQLIEQDKRASV